MSHRTPDWSRDMAENKSALAKMPSYLSLLLGQDVLVCAPIPSPDERRRARGPTLCNAAAWPAALPPQSLHAC